MGNAKRDDLVMQVIKKKPKYRNTRVMYQKWRFDSKLERDFYIHLQNQKEQGLIKLILRQVPIRLAPGSRLVVDFLVSKPNDPELYFYDTKGYMTAHSRTKIKLAEHLYGIKINIIRKGDF